MVAGIQGICVPKIFKIPRGTSRQSLSLVKLKTWILQLFWRWSPPLTFIRNLAKPFQQLFVIKCFASIFRRGSLSLLIWLVLLLCETNLIFKKRTFWWSFHWRVGPEHLALTAWKRYFSIAWCQFVVYWLKVVTHFYMKLWVSDHLALFLYQSVMYL